MKKYLCILVAFGMMLMAMLWGCTAQGSDSTETINSEPLPAESTSLQQEPNCMEPTESPDPLKLASDEELIEAMMNGRALEAWAVTSSCLPQSAEGVKLLAQICPEFKELLIRDSGLQSLSEYGLQIAEEYGHHEERRHRLNGPYMKRLLDYLFPYLGIDLTK